MDCMHAEQKEQSVFLFFIAKRRKIELYSCKLPLQIIYKIIWTNNNLVNRYFDLLF